MIWSYPNISIMYTFFGFLFGMIGVYYNDPVAKAISISFILGVFTCLLFETNTKMLRRLERNDK